jgi:hypothetical protein
MLTLARAENEKPGDHEGTGVERVMTLKASFCQPASAQSGFLVSHTSIPLRMMLERSKTKLERAGELFSTRRPLLLSFDEVTDMGNSIC